MAIDYTALKEKLVTPKIQEYGKSVSIRRPGSAAGYTKAWNAAQSRWYWYETAHPENIVYVDPATSPINLSGHAVEVAYEQTEIDGVTVLANDRRFKISDVANITTSDKLVVDSAVLNIVSAKPVQPGAVTLLYTLQCRGQ